LKQGVRRKEINVLNTIVLNKQKSLSFIELVRQDEGGRDVQVGWRKKQVFRKRKYGKFE